MTSRRLGCLTATGLLAAILTLLLLLGVFLLRGGRMFSPGPLHAQASGVELGGITSHAATGGDCAACHTAPWNPKPMAERCLDCHTAIAAALADSTTLHGALEAQGVAMDCRLCHSEHRGAAANLTLVNMQNFPHDAVGYSLAGHDQLANGAPFACSDCHVESLARFDVATCDDCHRQTHPTTMQTHVADFGTDCLGCHDGIDSYSRANFDHSRLAFPLTGSHVDAACSGCHVDARSVADLQAAPTDCVACHGEDDAHDGQFSQDCAACHVTTTWKDAIFDHSQTAFPLDGSHISVECVECHVDRVFQSTPTDCAACHGEDDAHDDQFGQDCAACHTTSDWQDATFDHSQTAFPLDGSHVEVECTQCHVDRVFQGTPTDCAACHVEDDPHDSQFGQDCAACHTTSDWQDATFDHSQTAFPLDGSHVEVECTQCHVDRVFQGTPTDCAACHVEDDPHDSQFGQDCAACHTTSDWQDATFDHSQTAFPLDGSHVEVVCVECHVDRVFQGTPTDCVACHVEPAFHLAAFGAAACSDCHTTTAWQPARFDWPHTFPLDHGESGVVVCQTCHPVQVQAYTCYGCHEHEPAEIEREHIEEGISDFQNCIECHPTGQKDEGEERERDGD